MKARLHYLENSTNLLKTLLLCMALFVVLVSLLHLGWQSWRMGVWALWADTRDAGLLVFWAWLAGRELVKR